MFRIETAREARLREMKEIASQRNYADLMVPILVRHAHREGIPIAEIASAVGVSRPTVHRIIREGESK